MQGEMKEGEGELLGRREDMMQREDVEEAVRGLVLPRGHQHVGLSREARVAMHHTLGPSSGAAGVDEERACGQQSKKETPGHRERNSLSVRGAVATHSHVLCCTAQARLALTLQNQA